MPAMPVSTFARFHELPLRSVRPEGWLRAWLTVQRDGLTGRCQEIGPPWDSPGWAAHEDQVHCESHWVLYEQTGYWYDGMARCGYLLDDAGLIARAEHQMDHVLANPDADGYLGPRAIKPPSGINRWSHAVFFRALMARHGATSDPAIARGIAGRLRAHYASGTSPHALSREIANVEIILWAYEQTGDEDLLRHAVAAYEAFNANEKHGAVRVAAMASDDPPTGHGVTFNELAKQGALLFKYTSRRDWLDATLNAYRKVDRDHMLVSGVNSSSEALCGRDPLASHETCDIADYTWSVGYLLAITGDATWGDRIERAVFNAGYGAVREDFRALQYFSCPNQVIADRRSNHNEFYGGEAWMSYRPKPGTDCCTGNVHRIFPNYAARMWMHDGRGGLVATLYGPGRVTFPAGGSDAGVTVTAHTQYPFAEQVRFTIDAPEPVAFPFWLRIPAWCAAPRIEVNGRDAGIALEPGTFACLERTFAPGDEVVLALPMTARCCAWPAGGVYVERGPLVYALAIDEDWRVDPDDPHSTPGLPAWNCYPASPWNYALALPEGDVDPRVETVFQAASEHPWTAASTPVALNVPARRVPGWTLRETGELDVHMQRSAGEFFRLERFTRTDGPFSLTPPLPGDDLLAAAGEVETVRLVPYGCTHLRLTLFPHRV